MKRINLFALATLALLSVSNSRPLWAAPTQTDKAPQRATSKTIPRVTRDNFVSLEWQQNIRQQDTESTDETSFKVEGNVLSYSSRTIRFGGGSGFGWGGGSTPETRGLSNRQLDSLIAKLNQSHIPALAGNYRPSNIVSGFGEVLILTLSDKDDQDQQFIIENYGAAAPKSYFDFLTSFRELANAKFPNSPFPLTPAKTTTP